MNVPCILCCPHGEEGSWLCGRAAGNLALVAVESPAQDRCVFADGKGETIFDVGLVDYLEKLEVRVDGVRKMGGSLVNLAFFDQLEDGNPRHLSFLANEVLTGLPAQTLAQALFPECVTSDLLLVVKGTLALDLPGSCWQEHTEAGGGGVASLLQRTTPRPQYLHESRETSHEAPPRVCEVEETGVWVSTRQRK
jgi:hypothetical protein